MNIEELAFAYEQERIACIVDEVRSLFPQPMPNYVVKQMEQQANQLVSSVHALYDRGKKNVHSLSNAERNDLICDINNTLQGELRPVVTGHGTPNITNAGNRLIIAHAAFHFDLLQRGLSGASYDTLAAGMRTLYTEFEFRQSIEPVASADRANFEAWRDSPTVDNRAKAMHGLGYTAAVQARENFINTLFAFA